VLVGTADGGETSVDLMETAQITTRTFLDRIHGRRYLISAARIFIFSEGEKDGPDRQSRSSGRNFTRRS